jgi:hypothetical protein
MNGDAENASMNIISTFEAAGSVRTLSAACAFGFASRRMKFEQLMKGEQAEGL